MVVTQKPREISEWMSADAGQPDWYVSNDFDSYNEIHMTTSLVNVDLTFAEKWNELYQRTGDKRAVNKAMFCMWMAKSHHNSYVQGDLDQRVTKGLFSGHRNTARDNTMLHVVYNRAIRGIINYWAMCKDKPRKQKMCGDDEVCAYPSWEQAVIHPLVADAIGMPSKAEKGMLSRHTDEFL